MPLEKLEVIFQNIRPQKEMIRHSVIFKLKYPQRSIEEQDFFHAAKKLKSIAGVEKFECLKQTSSKIKFEYGISMEFSNQELYVAYCAHPNHVSFVQEWWMNYVEDFMEIDYAAISDL